MEIPARSVRQPGPDVLGPRQPELPRGAGALFAFHFRAAGLSMPATASLAPFQLPYFPLPAPAGVNWLLVHRPTLVHVQGRCQYLD